MGDPVVSVVMAVRDGERYIRQALETVFGQTRPPDEVIVVDDGSVDRTREFGETFPTRVVSIDAAGVSAARNVGIAEASGDLIAFIDHDDLWLPRKLERQVAYLEERPGVDYVLCRFRIILEPGTERAMWIRDDYLTQGVMTLCTGALMARRSSIDAVGPFATELDMGEDADWLMRAHEAGMTRGVLDEVLFEYRVHDANATVRRPPGRAGLFDLLRRASARRAEGAKGGRHAR